MTENIIDFILGTGLGVLVWFFGGFDGLFIMLVTFCIIDYITGMAAACCTKTLSSSIGFRGIAKKCVLFMFVGMAHLTDNYLPGDSDSVRSMVCLFYIINEGVSIFENAEKLGVKIPKPLHNVLIKLHDMQSANDSQEAPENHENHENHEKQLITEPK